MGLPQGTEISSLSGCTSISLRQILIKGEGLTVTTCLGYEDIIANLSLSTVLQKEAGGPNYCGVLTEAFCLPRLH